MSSTTTLVDTTALFPTPADARPVLAHVKEFIERHRAANRPIAFVTVGEKSQLFFEMNVCVLMAS